MVTTLFASIRTDPTDVNVHQVKLCPNRAATAAAAAAADWVPLEYIVTLGRGGGGGGIDCQQYSNGPNLLLTLPLPLMLPLDVGIP